MIKKEDYTLVFSNNLLFIILVFAPLCTTLLLLYTKVLAYLAVKA